MNLNIIKILGIIIVTICCILATYTDVKQQIIPNKLTITTIIIGILLVTTYYITTENINLFYYVSIGFVFIFSYMLWKLGVWAGGDVKLFTAISTLLVPEFLQIIPKYSLWGMEFPLTNMKVPALFVIFNSVLSIIPLILIYVSWSIINDKSHLKNRIKFSFIFNDSLLSLNSLIVSSIIISELNVYSIIIKLFLLLVCSYLISKTMKHDLILILISVTIIIQQIITGNIIQYILELTGIILIFTVKYIYQKQIIKEALTDKIEVNKLEEGMILQYPLYYKNKEYYFDKSKWYNKKDGKLICSNNACGLTYNEIKLIQKVYTNSTVSIKKGLSFAPFIMSGLLITLIFGNTYHFLILLLEMI